MPLTGAPLNRREPFVDRGGFLRDPAYRWIVDLRGELDATPQLEADAIELVAQTGTLGTTIIPTGALPAGYYRVSTFLRVTTPAATSSSVQVSVSYLSGGVSCSEAGTAVTANATNAPQSDVFVIKIDNGSPVTFSTAYASVPAAAMAYELTVILERLSA